MCAAALPVQHQSGRQTPERGCEMLAMVRGHHSQGTRNPETDQRSEPKNNTSAKRWNVGAWDAYEYRANAPKLSQHDRDKSTRRSKQRGVAGDAELINMGPALQHKEGKLRRRATTPQSRAKKDGDGDGCNDRSSQSEKIRGNETQIPLKLMGEKVKDRAWLGNIKKSFIRKFFAASTLATKNTKRKKVIEILDGMDVNISLWMWTRSQPLQQLWIPRE